MISLVFLGVGSSQYSVEKGNTSVYLNTGDRKILIDMGEGSLHNMLKQGIDPVTITDIFLSHYHSDHFANFQGIINYIWTRNSQEEAMKIIKRINVYSNLGSVDEIKRIIWIPHQYDWIGVVPNFISLEGYPTIELSPTSRMYTNQQVHTFDAVSFIFEDDLYQFDLLKLYRMSILYELENDLSPLYSQEKDSIHVFNVDYPINFFRKSSSGLRIGFSLDSSDIFSQRDFFTNLDILVSECTYSLRESVNHTSARTLGRFCKETDPFLLLVIHRAENIANYVNEIGLYFPRTAYPTLTGPNSNYNL